MVNVNNAQYDAQIRHEHFVQRYSTARVNELINLLNESEVDILNQIMGYQTSNNRKRLDQLLERLRGINESANAEILRRLGEELEDFAGREQIFTTKSLNESLPTSVAAAIQYIEPTEAILFTSASQSYLNHQILGQSLSQHITTFAESQQGRLNQAVRQGFLQGQTNQQIARNYLGTKAQKGRNGIRQQDRRALDAIVRSSVNAAANEARERVYKRNEPLIKEIEWVSVLDGRTTSVCRSLDGRKWPVGEGPRPPAHFNCRSTTVPVTKSFKELGLDRDELPPTMRPFVRSTKAIKDIPKSDRDLLVGRISAGRNYGDWLRAQPAGFQDEVLGVTRGRLFRNGGLKIDKFRDYNMSRDFTLKELEKMHPQAFVKAGIEL